MRGVRHVSRDSCVPHMPISKFSFLLVFSRDDICPSQVMPCPLPRVPGHEVIGDVVAVSYFETQWKIGQRVGAGWHGGHCATCTRCRAGDYLTCENQNINGGFLFLPPLPSGVFTLHCTLTCTTRCRGHTGWRICRVRHAEIGGGRGCPGGP